MNSEVPQNNKSNLVLPKTEVSPPRRLKKLWIIGGILGVILAVANLFALGTLSIVFMYITPLFFEIPLKLSRCGGEGCWGILIVLGSFLFLIFVPLAVVFLGYLYNFKSYPNNRKKYTIVSLGILFILLNTLIALLNYQSSIYLTGIRDYQTLYASYSSMNECERTQPYEITGACYGYFASEQNDITLCDEFLRDFKADKKYAKSECIIGYSIYKKNPSICSKSPSELFGQKCLAINYIVNNESGNCNKLTDDYWKKQCDAGTEWNPLVRMYAKFRLYNY